MNKVPPVNLDKIVEMCRWPHTEHPGRAARSRRRTAAAETLETLAAAEWLTVHPRGSKHGVRILPQTWWVQAVNGGANDSISVPPAPLPTRR